MSDKEFFILLAVVLAVIQFLYRLWDKKDNKLVIAAITSAVRSFEPDIERTRRTYGIVKDLKRMHDVRDDDGRPMWYLPKEIIETQREIVSTQHLMAENQKNTLVLMDKMIDKIDKHHDNCKSQFTKLDKKI
jgi:hypothetical protein